MPLTTLDPNTALIVIDLQKGLRYLTVAHPFDGMVERSRALADAFRARGLPVVLVNVTGGAPGRTEAPKPNLSTFPADFAELLPELGQQPGDILVTKQTWGAFASTDLNDRLKALGVTQVVVTGVSTATGVEATARQAFEYGYNVTLAIDAMTDPRAAAHDYSIDNVFPRLGETGLAGDIIALLERRT